MFLLQARMLDEGTKKLLKAGILSETLELTNKGVRILLTVLLTDIKGVKEAVLKVAEDQLAEKEEEKKG